MVLEAMAMGKPVIATRWGGPADYLDATCGVLVEPESYAGLVAGFAEAMQRMLDSPGLARSMGAAGRERAIRDFDWQKKIDRVIGIFRSVAEKSGASPRVEDQPRFLPPLLPNPTDISFDRAFERESQQLQVASRGANHVECGIKNRVRACSGGLDGSRSRMLRRRGFSIS